MNQWIRSIQLLASLGFLAAAHADDHRPNQFHHHPDIRVELFAREPHVVDPVSLTFAADGTGYVVEMRDYPFGVGEPPQPGGTIRLLRDRDGDGRAEESKIFAEGLSFPTSVMPWRGGILVVAPPEILWLRDTDGDDRADQREVVLSGLRRGVTDSNANSLRWGIDNRIHLANGGNGGRVRLTGSADSPLDLGNSDFAIDLDAGTVARTARTGGGFGLVFDDFGHSFTTYNINYLQQRILPLRYLEQSPEMFSIRATENISDHGQSARIYPVVQAVTRVNHPEQAGHFSSAGGMGYLKGGYFSSRLADSIFVCDVVCNLIHRDRLREDGPIFAAGRAAEEQQSEFLASYDPACRLIGLEHGPDGALYVLDMQRDVIEHPDYIPAAVKKDLDLRGGEDRGRIYRIMPADGLPDGSLPPRDLSAASTEQLAATLAAVTPWHRDTAHRLIIQQAAPETADVIRRVGLRSAVAEARVRSLWILERLSALSDVEIIAALSDPEPGVRENAIALAERRRNESIPLGQALLNSLGDPHPRVRFRAALALDGFQDSAKFEPLLQMLLQDCDHAWSRYAVLLSIDQDARRLLMGVWESPEFQGRPDDEAKFTVVRELAEVAAATAGSDQPLAGWLTELQPRRFDPGQFAALLAGLDAGWQRRPAGRLGGEQMRQVVTAWAADDVTGLAAEMFDLIALYELEPPPALQAAFAEARRAAIADSGSIDSRVAAINLLARARDQETYELLIGLLSAGQPTAIQSAAVAAAAGLRRGDLGEAMLMRWPEILPGVRAEVIDLVLGRREYHDALITALEQGQVLFRELNLDLEQRRRLLRWSSRAIGERAAKLFGDHEYSNRKQIVDQWLSELPPHGDPVEGHQIFIKTCASCHVARGQGHRVGPDLQALSHRSVEDLLTHILDPNMAINPNYVSCVVETEDGRIVNGLLTDETAESITIVQAENKRTTLGRDEIVQWKVLETSLMPEGLEKDLTPTQMRSLISFLQQEDP